MLSWTKKTKAEPPTATTTTAKMTMAAAMDRPLPPLPEGAQPKQV